jgi:hypothetical protein
MARSGDGDKPFGYKKHLFCLGEKMKVSKRVLVSVVFLTLATLACQALNNLGQPALTGKDFYLKLRNDALNTKPETFGIKADPNSNIPYGVIMDTELDVESVSTLISFTSGDASLIATYGNGRTDGIKYQEAQIASKKFVTVAADFVGKMELVTDYPLPTVAGNIRFYVITPNGIYTTKEMTESSVIGGSFYRLWKAGADVITAFRLSDESPK